MRKLWILGGVAVLVAACGGGQGRSGFEKDDGAGGNLAGGNGTEGDPGSLGGAKAGDKADASECQKMDIVFVVDDSGSMDEEQTNLAQNFPKFVSVLNNFKTKSGAQLDWRIAVTTTGRDVKYTVQFAGQNIPLDEKGDNGKFRRKSECGASKAWVERSDSKADTTFSCLAKVGTQGPGMEMPLYSLKLALNERMADGTNKGFQRDDALLGVVILTDEDDCSREDNNFTMGIDTCAGVKPVKDYAAMLDGAAGGAGRWAAAVIAEKKCTSSFGDAEEARRLKEFSRLAGPNGSFSSICDGDLTKGLEKALATFDFACKNFPGVR